MKDEYRDAVIVIPGIMGSELVDTDSGDVLWGLSDPRWYVRAWTSGSSLTALRVTDDERLGRTGRITATRLLRFPAFAPVLRGAEPYTRLLSGLREVAAHPDAVAEFPYDWRLAVEHNAGELAKLAEQHLARWRAHPAGGKDAKLVLVAHSMGGLLARYFTTTLGVAGEVRATITLGTPFRGAVKAACILGQGLGTPLPLPRRRLRDLARTFPGVHALLPSYRCVDEGSTARRLSVADVTAIGGDPDLARQAADLHDDLARSSGTARAVVGVWQPTMQSLVLRDGVVEPKYYTCEHSGTDGVRRIDRGGDGTVYRDSASGGVAPVYLPQAHGALAKTSEVIAHVQAVLTETELGPPLGATVVGLDVPDVVQAGKPFDIVVSTGETPGDTVSCRMVDAVSGAGVSRPIPRRRDGTLVATAAAPKPGLYRVEVKAGGFSAVTELVLAADSEDFGG
ncbi:hypothetical protein [Amycolatopsis sp. NPDC051071]|uniref:esterase/lipase family protein n=1 Tax=Amycolatopsis sp. NPDC051071 TaxID=3154637 RepID=UPI0034319502